MSNYTKSTNFATKDNLSPGDPLKIVRGTEIDTEFNNISTAISTKTDNSAAAITGGSISGITDLAIADGGTGASTATAAINNLLPAQTSAANKYLQSDGTNVSWDAVTLSTADITGTLAVANGGTGVTSSTGTGNVVLSNSPTLVTPILGTPQSGNFSTGTFTWPTFNQNTTGTAAGLSATLATTSGGTGLTSFTSGGVVYASSTSALATGSALTYNGTGLGVGVASASFALDVGGANGTNIALRSTGTSNAVFRAYVNSAESGTIGFLNGGGTYFEVAGTETLRLTSTSLYTASGINVGIGTSSPSTKLDVRSAIGTSVDNPQNILAIDTTSYALGNGGGVSFGYVFNAGGSVIARAAVVKGIKENATDGNYASALTFSTTANSASTSEKMRLDSAGNLLVGSTTNTYGSRLLAYLDSYDTYCSTIELARATNTQYGLRIQFSGQDPNNTTSEFIAAFGTTTKRFVVYSNGNVANTNNSYGAISDVKLKENIVDASPKLADLMQVKVRNYNLIGDTTKQLGVVAQELETVFPAMVDVSPDKDAQNNDLGTTTKAVKYSVFVPMLIKAMQEQQAIIESLKARLDAANL